MEGMHLINSIGKISDEKRDEAILVSDVLGMESYKPKCCGVSS